MEIKELKCQYIEMNAFINNNCIDIIDINDFNKLIIDNNIETIYCGEKIVENDKTKCFMFILNTNIFTFSYQLEDGYYQTIKDYIDASSNNFTSLYAFNSAKKYGLNNQEEYEVFEQKLFEDNKKIQKYPIIGLIKINDFKKINRCVIASICGCDEQEAYNITVINERFEKKFKQKYPNSYSTFLDLKYNTNYNYNKSVIDFLNVIIKYDDYYFIFVDMADKYIDNAKFAQCYNQKEYFDSISKYRYTKGNTLFEGKTSYSDDSLLPECCYIMRDTYLIIEEMKKKGYLKFFVSSNYKLLDSYAYDPRYIYEKSVRYKQ